MRFFGWSPIFWYECWLGLSKIIFLWGEILKFIAGLKKLTTFVHCKYRVESCLDRKKTCSMWFLGCNGMNYNIIYY